MATDLTPCPECGETGTWPHRKDETPRPYHHRDCSQAAETSDPPYSTTIRAPHHVTQTIFYSADLNAQGVYGNCMQASLASLLGMPLDAVPNLLTFGDWFGAFELWLSGIGLTVRAEDYVDEPSAPCLILGRSSRGVGHIIARFSPDDEWDPHPSREGLVSRDRVYYFDPRQATAAETSATTTEYAVFCHDGQMHCAAMNEPHARDYLRYADRIHPAGMPHTVKAQTVTRSAWTEIA